MLILLSLLLVSSTAAYSSSEDSSEEQKEGASFFENFGSPFGVNLMPSATKNKETPNKDCKVFYKDGMACQECKDSAGGYSEDCTHSHRGGSDSEFSNVEEQRFDPTKEEKENDKEHRNPHASPSNNPRKGHRMRFFQHHHPALQQHYNPNYQSFDDYEQDAPHHAASSDYAPNVYDARAVVGRAHQKNNVHHAGTIKKKKNNVHHAGTIKEKKNRKAVENCIMDIRSKMTCKICKDSEGRKEVKCIHMNDDPHQKKIALARQSSYGTLPKARN